MRARHVTNSSIAGPTASSTNTCAVTSTCRVVAAAHTGGVVADTRACGIARIAVQHITQHHSLCVCFPISLKTQVIIDDRMRTDVDGTRKEPVDLHNRANTTCCTPHIMYVDEYAALQSCVILRNFLILCGKRTKCALDQSSATIHAANLQHDCTQGIFMLYVAASTARLQTNEFAANLASFCVTYTKNIC